MELTCLIWVAVSELIPPQRPVEGFPAYPLLKISLEFLPCTTYIIFINCLLYRD